MFAKLSQSTFTQKTFILSNSVNELGVESVRLLSEKILDSQVLV